MSPVCGESSAQPLARVVLHEGCFDEELRQHAAAALHSRLSELSFCQPDLPSPLQSVVFQGSLLAGIVAVYHRPKPVDGQRACGVSVFCDCRPVGGEPAFILTSKTRLTAAGHRAKPGLVHSSWFRGSGKG